MVRPLYLSIPLFFLYCKSSQTAVRDSLGLQLTQEIKTVEGGSDYYSESMFILAICLMFIIFWKDAERLCARVIISDRASELFTKLAELCNNTGAITSANVRVKENALVGTMPFACN